MSMITYNNHKLTYKDNKFDLNEIYKILDYEVLDNSIYVTKEELLKFLNNDEQNDKIFINFLHNNFLDDDFIEPIMDIFTFLKKNNLILYTNNNILLNLWYSFKDNKEILITNDLLDFMGFLIKNKPNIIFSHHKTYIKFLLNNKIYFEEISYQHDKAINYQEIQDYIKSADKKSLESKKWLIITLDNFKESIMVLNNKKANEVRMYYMHLEKIFYLYLNYLKEYDIKLNEIKNKKELKEIEKYKNKEIEEIKSKLKENERINSNIQIFLNNIKLKNKNGFIYIATSKYCAKLNIFKVGVATTNIEYKNKPNLDYILDDKIYFCFFEKVYNVYELESIINNLLEGFKDKKKEIFIIHYVYLEDLIKLIIKNVNEAYEYTNNLIKNNLLKMYNLKPFIPDAIIL